MKKDFDLLSTHQIFRLHHFCFFFFVVCCLPLFSSFFLFLIWLFPRILFIHLLCLLPSFSSISVSLCLSLFLLFSVVDSFPLSVSLSVARTLI